MSYENDKTLKYDSYYMRIAIEASKMSWAKKLKVGAVLVKDGIVISDGWNGMPKGMDNSCEHISGYENGIPVYKTKDEVLHAEENAILKAARSNNSTVNATLYITTSPCIRCSRMIHSCGISRIVYLNFYRDCYGIDFLKSMGLDVHKLKSLGVWDSEEIFEPDYKSPPLTKV